MKQTCLAKNRKEKEMATIGVSIDEKVQEYIELYEAFRADELFKDQARSLAMHDMAVQKFVAEKVLERLREYIDIREA